MQIITFQIKDIFRSATRFNLTHIKRIPGYPKEYEDHVAVSFYVINPVKSTPVLKGVLASMLFDQELNLEYALNQQVVLQTSAGPDTPAKASKQQIANSVIIRIPLFSRNQVCKFELIQDARYVKQNVTGAFSPCKV